MECSGGLSLHAFPPGFCYLDLKIQMILDRQSGGPLRLLDSIDLGSHSSGSNDGRQRHTQGSILAAPGNIAKAWEIMCLLFCIAQLYDLDDYNEVLLIAITLGFSPSTRFHPCEVMSSIPR